jgi:hypothetical protein
VIGCDVFNRNLFKLFPLTILALLVFPALAGAHELIATEFENSLQQSLRPGSGTIAVQSFSTPPGVSLDRPLAEDDTVAVALRNNAGLLFLSLPFAPVGGVVAAFMTGWVFTLGSLVGSVTVIGIAAPKNEPPQS